MAMDISWNPFASAGRPSKFSKLALEPRRFPPVPDSVVEQTDSGEKRETPSVLGRRSLACVPIFKAAGFAGLPSFPSAGPASALLELPPIIFPTARKD
jgi:hypothetical protein